MLLMYEDTVLDKRSHKGTECEVSSDSINQCSLQGLKSTPKLFLYLNVHRLGIFFFYTILKYITNTIRLLPCVAHYNF